MGYIRTTFSDHAPFLSFNPSSFGLVGFIQQRQFPTFTGMDSLNSSLVPNYGGMQPIGTSGQGQSYDVEGKPTYTTSLTWIKGKHSYKFGASLVEEGLTSGPISGVTFTTGIGPTSEPFAPTQSFNGFTSGFGYASWLLGDYSSVSQTATVDPRLQSMNWSAFAQDSWKLTRKLTIDYGLRWDLFGVVHEEYGRWGQFSETAPNANAGGHPGSTIFASSCNCPFYQPVYPYAFAPRVGVAYQIDPKTVFRAGWGFTYALVGPSAGATVATNGAYPVTANSPSYVPTTGCGGSAGTSCQFVNDQTPGWIVQPTWPVTTNVYPTLGTTAPAPTMPDQNQNRPPRVNQFSVGFQREITRNFIVEATYVGNRAAWLTQSCITGCNGNGGLTHVSPQTYAEYGLYPYPGTGPCASGAGSVCENSSYAYAPAGVNCVSGNDCDRALLAQPLTSTAVIQKLAAAGVNPVPYSCASPCGFSLSNPLSSIVGRPFPQFGAIGAGSTTTGGSKYDSLQAKATKRMGHGFQAGGYFTWAQGFNPAAYQDDYNPASNQNSLMAIPPRVLNFNASYVTQKVDYFNSHAKFVNTLIKDWQVSFFANYQSGAFLAIPATATAEFLPTQDVYVKGQPLYTPGVNLNNLGTYNPFTTQVLNPAAWAQCPVNSNCGDSGNDFLKNFRGPRHPTENANIGRNFRIKERWNFQVRAEFTNIFNRLLMPLPSTASPQNAVTKNSLGILTSGYGGRQRLPGAQHGQHLRRDNRRLVAGGTPGNDHRPFLVLI